MNDWTATYSTDPATGRVTGTRISPAGGARAEPDKPPSEGGVGAKGNKQTPAAAGAKSVEDWPEYVDKSAPAPAVPGQRAQSVEDWPEHVDTSVPMQPEREVGFGSAAAAGARSGLTFGFDPALQGLKAAGQAPGGGLVDQVAGHMARIAETTFNPIGSLMEAYGAPTLASLIGLPQGHEIVQGLARIIHDKIQGPTLSSLITGGTPAQNAYTQGRNTAQETQDLAAKQQPWGYYPSLVASSLALPVPGGPVAGAGRLANLGRGVATGAALGGAQGVGEAVSRGESLPDVAYSGAKGAAVGGAVGGPLGAILPAAARPAVTAGERAAQTSIRLGEPLPRGVVSDRPWLQRTTAHAQAVPILGSRISHGVERTAEAAGEHVEGIAGGLTQGSRDRAVADTVVRPGLEAAVEANRQTADALYKGVRGLIDQDAHFTMPRTQATLDAIAATRRAAGHENPEAGLGQFRNVSEGATFNGAHRARADAREAGNALTPHPGYNAADYNRLTRAMTADLRSMVQVAATDQTPAGQRAAVNAFNEAERAFGPIAEANRRLNALARAPGETAISKLLNAAKEKGGDVRLLAELERNMPPAAFQHLGGQLLFELGHSPKTGEFSLAKFVTEWDKLSERGRDILFSPQHRADLEEIFQMGQHIKGALKESSTSHSATPLVAFEMLKELGAFIGDVYHGGGGIYTAGAAATTAGIGAVTHWLGNPVQARAISNWTRAYRAATLGAPTPARIAALKIASRNLAHNLNIPIEDVMRTMQKHTPAAADEQQQDNRPQVPQSR